MNTVPDIKPQRERKPWNSYVAAFLLNDMAGVLKRRGLTIATCGIPPETISYLLRLNYDDHIDRKTARASLEYMLDQAQTTQELIAWLAQQIKERLDQEKSHP